MKEPNDPFELEKAHPTVSDSSAADESDPILSIKAGDIWTDFVRDSAEEKDKETRPRQNGNVPLLDDMTGIRQWE